MTRLTSALLCTCVLSCGEAALPTEPVATVPPTIRLVGDSLEVVGIFGTDAPCYTFESRALVSQVALIVVVEAVPTAAVCVAIIAAFADRVALARPVRVGRVMLMHDLRQPRAGPIVVRDTVLNVP